MRRRCDGGAARSGVASTDERPRIRRGPAVARTARRDRRALAGRGRDRDLRNPCRPRGRCAARRLRRGRDAGRPGGPARRARRRVGCVARAPRRHRHGRGPGRPRRGSAPARRAPRSPRRSACSSSPRRVRYCSTSGRIGSSSDAVEAEADGELVRLVRLRASPAGRARRFDSPMVGRERERRRLDDAFEQATGRPLVPAVHDPRRCRASGSRVSCRSSSRIWASHALVARGRCLPYGEGITYWPVLEAVRDAAALDDAASDAEQPRAARSPCSRVMDEAESLARRARRGCRPRRADEQRGRDVPGDARVRRGARPAATARAGLRRHPLGGVDVPRSRRPHRGLDARRSDPAPLHGSTGAARGSAAVGWREAERHLGAARAAVRERERRARRQPRGGRRDLDDAARRHVVEAASGNPLFVEEMLALVLEQGGDAAPFEVPPTIQALLAARLDRSARRRAARSSRRLRSRGKVFHEATAGELASLAPDDVQPAPRVARSQGARSGRTGRSSRASARSRFRHLLIRDAAYEAMPKEVRARLHERYADWLERRRRRANARVRRDHRLPPRAGIQVPLGARADRCRGSRSSAAGRPIGSRARDGVRSSEATRRPARISSRERSRSSRRTTRCVSSWCRTYASSRAWRTSPGPSACSRRRSKLPRRRAIARLAAHALVQRGFLRLFTDAEVTPRELFDVSERAVAVFESLGDELGLARAWRLASQAHYLDGRPGSMRRGLRARARARPAGRRSFRGARDRGVVRDRAAARARRPQPRHEPLRASFSTRSRITPSSRADPRALRRPPRQCRGASRGASTRWSEARRLMAERSEWIWIVDVSGGAAFILWHGRPRQRAEAELRPAYEALKAIGEKSHFSSIAHYALGRRLCARAARRGRAAHRRMRACMSRQ